MNKRLFLAIPISEKTKKTIVEKRTMIDPELKWIPVENLHITLHFLGKTGEEKIPHLINIFSEVITNYQPFHLNTKEIGTKAGKFQQMVWVKFTEAPEFIELSKEIAKALDVSLKRKPLPHINLIRIKDQKYFLNNPVLPLILNEEINVKQVELWESILRPGKFPIYKSIYNYILNEGERK